ncbi:Serine/arginine regulated nuclear matrix protein [Entamoeba marina]
MSGTYFRGTSIEQDGRLRDKHEKMKKEMIFPLTFFEKVNFSKVNLDVIRAWVTNKITEILQVEDEIVIETVMSFIETNGNETDPRDLQLDISAFLEDKTEEFTKELWDLCLLAEKSKDGIPEFLVTAAEERLLKEQQIKKEKDEKEKDEKEKKYQKHHHRTRSHSRGRSRSRERRYHRSRSRSRSNDRRYSRRTDYGRRDSYRGRYYRGRSRSRD